MVITVMAPIMITVVVVVMIRTFISSFIITTAYCQAQHNHKGKEK
jgi:hypothetical protein